MKTNTRYLFLLQGSYYLLTGLWPFVHFSSYMAQTGWESNLWLSKMLAGIPFILGLGFIMQLFNRQKNPALQFIALISSFGFLAADVLSFFSDFYLLYAGDALFQLAFLGSWLIIRKQSRRIRQSGFGLQNRESIEI